MPGVLMLVLMSLWSIRVGHRSAVARGPGKAFDLREAAAALRAAIWEVPLPIIVLGGVYSGVFAVSEAAAVTAVYVLVAEVLIYREVPLRRLPGVMRDSMVLVAGS
jgi:TRAP-type C4-dicarboxylate transport system permease large subunit